jgi:hypothetical protein
LEHNVGDQLAGAPSSEGVGGCPLQTQLCTPAVPVFSTYQHPDTHKLSTTVETLGEIGRLLTFRHRTPGNFPQETTSLSVINTVQKPVERGGANRPQPSSRGAPPVFFHRSSVSGPLYPLKHSAIPKSYPQLWTNEGDIAKRSRQLAGKLFSSPELQACKLPTLWISAVDKEKPRHPSGCRGFSSTKPGSCSPGIYSEIRIQLAATSRARTATRPAAWTRPCLRPRGV